MKLGEFFKANKLSSSRVAVYGIEVLAIAIFTLFIPHLFLEIGTGAVLTVMIVAIYYLTKSILILKHHAKRYRKIVCDIKEIIKKEPKKKGGKSDA